MKLHLLLPLTASLIMLSACDNYQKKPEPSVAAGETLFIENCSSCHPRTGRGDYLKRIPVTLLNMKSKHELKDWIIGSNEHREMPNFNHLSEEELENLANYLHNEITR